MVEEVEDRLVGTFVVVLQREIRVAVPLMSPSIAKAAKLRCWGRGCKAKNEKSWVGDGILI